MFRVGCEMFPMRRVFLPFWAAGRGGMDGGVILEGKVEARRGEIEEKMGQWMNGWMVVFLLLEIRWAWALIELFTATNVVV